MPALILWGIFLFTIALVFYSISVWAGWLSKRLKLWHIYVFLIGLFTDYLATALTYVAIGGIVFTWHAILGFISIALMTIHVVWSIITYLNKSEQAITNFHRISVIVWGIWMVSYLSGFGSGIEKVIQ
ncbi:MAG: TIGR03987 family protein [Chromatiales bacterium]|jgi:uncharacterized repeat protein (TIGR03987 family)|nr:TIGR03987 family protein [Chromatiales bacterium]